MKRWLCFTVLLLPTAALPALAQQSAASIIVAEREFAQAALETTTKQAFLAHMSDSAVVFSNGKPVLAKPLWQARAEQPNAPKLIWGPAVASLASSGDLGYTTGPWYIQQADGKRVSHGEFFTIWSRQPNGHYKFLADVGISHAAPVKPETLSQITEVPARRGKTTKASRATVLGLDGQLNEAVETQGNGAGYAAWLSTQARLLRENSFPLTSLGSIMPVLAAEPVRSFTPRGGQLAKSGELGFTYGTYQTRQNAAAQGGYLHVWQQEAGRWRLVAEVLSPTSSKP